MKDPVRSSSIPFTGFRWLTMETVHVADRPNNRLQVFTLDGKFQREIFVERKTKLLGTAFSVAFSPDSRQELLYRPSPGTARFIYKIRARCRRVGNSAGSAGYLEDS